MAKIKHFDELITLQRNVQRMLGIRRPVSIDGTASEADEYQAHVLVCGGTGCQASDSALIVERFQAELELAGLGNKIKTVTTGCFGFCEQGPIVKIFPDNVLYVQVTPDDVPELVQQQLINGQVVERLLYVEPSKKERLTADLPFYKSQVRIALRNCGVIAPEDIHEYIAAEGYQALGTVLTRFDQDRVIDEIKRSGLRGRGGGGFSTGAKWELTRRSEADQKYIICNADEGDPGAFMDRSILEGDPHSVLEAMAIAGYAIGANQGYIYIRAEYPLAIQRLRVAIRQARDFGLLGENILGSGFSFDLELRYGAGAFVCGEETALIHSIEGQRGEPTVKPPFPAVRGLWGKPTSVNNVETFANIPPIILKGAEWYAGIGTEKSKGTKVFALAGKINNTGLVEVPMGTTLREIIFDIGGGIQGNRQFKAAQTGGPSGGCIPAQYLDIPIDYESLTSIGSMMGSGGLIVMDEEDCMVNVAKFYLEFTVDESCGRCTACRVGTKRLHELLTKITDGKATIDDLDKLEDLARIVKDTSLCGLGQSAPNPILSTLKYFRDEYLAHIVDKRCPSKVCTNLLQYTVTDNCSGCTLCARKCPVNCISGSPKTKHEIDQNRCIKCGACFEACRFKAIERR